ncbi:Ammonium transporter [Carbonactinospora thermoautotrophica]|uniref:Ammonium transporter n=2 Tax=Carbonactinospora thermoautotrophica TaxID=1469144 RepID=A0A132MLM4_9ACTN|nr:hypothetical protein [Carbonactinospora thermoautotrophica]KWW98655.1 Ammonium transporter [Carbonactinospora thermoautotrophica]
MAATLVGLMSIPGVALLYGGLVPRKWVVNTMLMVFSAFSVVLIVWVLWGFKMGFGSPVKLGPGILGSFVGHPAPVLGPAAEQGRASIPLLEGSVGVHARHRCSFTFTLTGSGESKARPFSSSAL